jgi:hypothetical protein
MMKMSIAAAITLVSMSACLGRSAASSETNQTEHRLVTMRHIGVQDKPIVALIIASSARDLPPKTPDDLVRTFVVTAPVMSSVLDYVAVHAKTYLTERPTQLPPTGTFEVSWESSTGSAKYVVPHDASCSYFGEIQKLAEADTISGLSEAVRITRVRVGCK